jgi:thymidylate synthase
MIANFSDNGETFFGAYGPKILDQVRHVIDTLVNDPWSRQAVITIWRENPPSSKDIPCTISAQFFIRDGKLHCVDNMRSSDVWLGLPYDMFNFSMLSAYIALAIWNKTNRRIHLGQLSMNLGSLHLYDTNRKAAQRCLDDVSLLDTRFVYGLLLPSREWFGPGELVSHLWAVARQQPVKLSSDWCRSVAEGRYNKIKGE